MEQTTGTIGIIGAGTMGAGIAQVAALGGWTVELMDVDEAIARKAIDGIQKRLDRLVEKGRLTPEDRAAAGDRLLVATCPNCLAGSDVLLEAIVEDLDVKTTVLSGIIPALSSDAIVATNTSSLSVSALGERLGIADRVVGMHFFNPAPLMKLVEVIAGEKTETRHADRVAEIARSWGKQVARAADVPGFIVNHVARPYYLEAFRILADGYADAATIDAALKTLGGFRMGPLELTDLIGQDVNTATTRSVWTQLDHPPLLAPSTVQESLVERGELGRKSGRGVYDYTAETPTPALATPASDLVWADALRDAVTAFTTSIAPDAGGSNLDRYIVARIMLALIVQATMARDRGVATEQDIDVAMTYGVNYPAGPFEWLRTAGEQTCRALAAALNADCDDARFAWPASHADVGA